MVTNLAVNVLSHESYVSGYKSSSKCIESLELREWFQI